MEEGTVKVNSLQVGEIEYSAHGHSFVSNSHLEPGLEDLRAYILFPRILWLSLDSFTTGTNKTNPNKTEHALLLC